MDKPEDFEAFKGEFVIELKREQIFYKGNLYKKGKSFLTYSSGVEISFGDIVRITDITDVNHKKILFPVEKKTDAKFLAA
ncbi:MAG: hypothetical protein WAV11_00400 [Minisyncoccia bacterium]